MNETERIISDLREQKDYWVMRYKLNSDKDSNKYATVIDMAIKALEEKLEIDSLIQKYDTDCTAKDIVKSFIEYVKAEDNELAGFRILTNADKEDYEAWKRSKDKGCRYCVEDKCRLCTKLCDHWGDGGTDKCSADGTDDPCAYYNLINYCPMCGRKLVNENE